MLYLFGVNFMGELKNRKYKNTILPLWQIDVINKLSEDTRIPISRLAEEAWNDLFEKYGIELKKEPDQK